MKSQSVAPMHALPKYFDTPDRVLGLSKLGRLEMVASVRPGSSYWQPHHTHLLTHTAMTEKKKSRADEQGEAKGGPQTVTDCRVDSIAIAEAR
jgi:hypothetical protein